MSTALTHDESVALQSYESLLDLTDSSDWHLFHNIVRNQVASGEFSRNFEQAYKKMVDDKANELNEDDT